MAFYNENIIDNAEENVFFRQVVSTGPNAQIVVMSLKAGEDIGEEVHKVDQVLVFVSGEGKAVLNGEEMGVEAGTLTHVPAGTTHNFINTGDEPLKLYTIYAPPEHAPGTIHKTKEEAMAAEEEEIKS